MKKIVALALCLVMVLGLMTGCQKKNEIDVKTLLEKMADVMKDVTAEGMEAEMDIEMKMSAMGVSMTMGMEMDMDIQGKSDLSAMYMDMRMAVKVLGQSEETKMEMYGTMEDGEMVYYVYESTEDIWVKTVQEDLVGSLNTFMGAEEMNFTDLPVEWFSVAKKQETINGRKCYVLTQQTDGAYIQEQMGDYMTQQMLSQMTGAQELDAASMEEMEAMIQDMDWSKISGTTVYYVDAETYYPLEMHVEIYGMGDVFNSMFDALLEDAMAEMYEENAEFSVEIPSYKIVVKNMTYNDDVQVPTVPQEAIDNAIDIDAIADDTVVIEPDDSELSDNTPQADGSYLMTMDGASVSVMLPEGYSVYMSDAESISAMSEDMMSYIDYMLMPGFTAEEMQELVLEDVAWAQDEGYYKSHSEIGELADFQTMSLIYNDDTSCWYAWKEMPSGVLVMWTEVEGETYDLVDLIATVEIAVN